MTVKPHRQFPEATRPGLVVLSHLGWDFVWQRPQHLMTHAAATRPVLFVECPQFRPGITPHMQSVESGGVLVCRPQIPEGHDAATSQRMTAEVLAAHVRMLRLDVYDLWVYTPMELPVAALLEPRLVVYDCMDELSQFRFAPPELAAREAELLDRADVVFTGGYRLYEAKARLHGNAHPFPSSVDVGHFRRARGSLPDPVDQRAIGRPRLGWRGVIDERLDHDLIATVAAQRPEWQWVLVGPTAKIDPAGLPRAENLHYLGSKYVSPTVRERSNRPAPTHSPSGAAWPSGSDAVGLTNGWPPCHGGGRGPPWRPFSRTPWQGSALLASPSEPSTLARPGARNAGTPGGRRVPASAAECTSPATCSLVPKGQVAMGAAEFRTIFAHPTPTRHAPGTRSATSCRQDLEDRPADGRREDRSARVRHLPLGGIFEPHATSSALIGCAGTLAASCTTSRNNSHPTK